MGFGFESDPHSQSGHACPRNTFGITDYGELQPLEAILVFKRTEEIAVRGVTGLLDSAHLRSIHHHLFQDVFRWAGAFRVVNISKGDSNFGPALHIAGALAELFSNLKVERYLSGLPANRFSDRAAFVLGEFNAIHPFREGNGRTQREFIRQLALSAGHPLSWAGFTQQQMLDASIASHLRGDNAGLAAIIEAALFSTRETPPQP